jgi:hypothetical protein
MSIRESQSVKVTFPDCYDARAEQEATQKGYLGDVRVQLEDGSCYRLFFIDPVRLQQDLQAEAEFGRPYFTEPGLVILPEITTQAIREVVPRLAQEGFFKHLTPIR